MVGRVVEMFAQNHNDQFVHGLVTSTANVSSLAERHLIVRSASVERSHEYMLFYIIPIQNQKLTFSSQFLTTGRYPYGH